MGILKTLNVNGVQYSVTPIVPADSVTLLASAWVGEGDMCSQVVEVPGVTAHTKVDLQPTAEQLAEFHYKVLAFVAENDNGVITVYSIGDKPTRDHTIQITKTEVEGTGRIRGNTVGTTMPRPDWNQTDPTKADYILNKPDEGPAIVCEESGSIISLNDSANRLLKEFNLYGKTTQNGTPSLDAPSSFVVAGKSKNIFGGDALADKLVEVASATKNETAGTVTYYSGYISEKRIFDAPDQSKRYTVILYGKNTTATTPRVNLCWRYSDGTSDVFNFKTAGELSYCVVTSSASKKVVGLVGYNNVGSVILHYDKCGIFEGVVTEADFEPHPSRISVTVRGKNLIPDRWVLGTLGSSGGNVVNVTHATSYRVRDILLAPGTYTVSGPGTAYFYAYDASGKINTSITKTSGVATPYTFTISDECYVGVIGGSASRYTYQIEEGTKATAYEPYYNTSITMLTPNGLSSVPSPSGNYTDENGQKLLCDVVDFTKGIKYSRIRDFTTKDIPVSRVSTVERVGSTVRCWIYINPETSGLSSMYAKDAFMCDKLGYNSSYYADKLGAMGGKDMGYPNSFVLWLPPEAGTTPEEVAAYLTANPIRLLIADAKATEEALSEEELAWYASLHTCNTHTIVSNDAGAGMKLKYVADTKAYIDNKFNELATALVNNT